MTVQKTHLPLLPQCDSPVTFGKSEKKEITFSLFHIINCLLAMLTFLHLLKAALELELSLASALA